MTTKEPKRRGRPVGMGEEKLIKIQKVLDFVREYHKINSIAPTLSEISEAIYDHPNNIGVTSDMVTILINQGFLVKHGFNSGRSIALAKKLPRKRFYP